MGGILNEKHAVVESGALNVGTKVEVRYSKTRRFTGIIERVNEDGTLFEVNFDDGEHEEVPLSLIHQLETELSTCDVLDASKSKFKAGDKIEAKYRGKGRKWYPGVITCVLQNGLVDIDYFDGDTDRGLSTEFVRLPTQEGEEKTRKPDSVPTEILINEPEEKLGKGKKIDKGVINEELSDGKFDVDHDEGAGDKGLSKEFIRDLVTPKEDNGSTVDAQILQIAAPKSGKGVNTNRDEAIEEFVSGTRVEAKFRGIGRRFYKGIISSKNSDGTYDVEYDDGDVDQGLSPDAIRAISSLSNTNQLEPKDEAPSFRVGSVVEARHQGRDLYLPGIISSVNADETYDIVFESGEVERKVCLDLIRAKPKPTHKFMEGDRVECKYRGKGSRWYVGTIVACRKNDKFDIHYDDGDKDFKLSSEFIRPLHSPETGEQRNSVEQEGHKAHVASPKGDQDDKPVSDEKTFGRKSIFDKGDRVEAKFKGRGYRWYKATVTARLPNGTYNLQYDDGDTELRLPPDAVRAINRPSSGRTPPRNLSAYTEGSKVEVKYKGKSGKTKYYPGVIRKARLSGTFDIDYDDGQREIGVRPEVIKIAETELENKEETQSSSEAVTIKAENCDSVVESYVSVNAGGGSSSEESDNMCSSKQSKTYNQKVNNNEIDRNVEEDESISKEYVDIENEGTHHETHVSPDVSHGPTKLEQSCGESDRGPCEALTSNPGGKGNRTFRGVVSKVKVVHLYEIKYPDGTRDVNIPFEAFKMDESVKISDIKVGSSVDVLSWQDRI